MFKVASSLSKQPMIARVVIMGQSTTVVEKTNRTITIACKVYDEPQVLTSIVDGEGSSFQDESTRISTEAFVSIN